MRRAGTDTIQTTTRKNLVEAPLTHDPSALNPAMAPLTPRKRGFTPLARYNVTAAPEKPAGNTLDRRSSEAFRRAKEEFDWRASLLTDPTRPHPQAYSYLGGLSANQAVVSQDEAP